ncbi:GGDEF domain-containing protein [Vibrio sp. T187]|uniref:diguanylate cyclase n=1 Tax=Vibrio TaxID=662 RepID=UPI0010C9F462|nr:GGDEF domain-containing protein [Vibrio sp. T187]
MLPPATTLKEQILTVACFTLGTISLGLAILNAFYMEAVIFGALELSFSLFCFYVVERGRRNQISGWHYPCVAAFFTLIIMYGLSVTKVSSALILWTFCLPVLYHLFFNRFLGSFLTLMVLITCLTLVGSSAASVNSLAIINFSLPYVTVWIISFSYEEVRERVQINLQELALTDTLTQAKNRLSLLNDTKQHAPELQNSFLLHFDLDHFKLVNDTYGHSCGDEVLKSTCDVVRQTLGSKYLYRIGGEEFCAIFEATDQESAFELSELIRTNVESNPILIDSNVLNVTISAGLISLDLTQDSIDTALQHTDKALYLAKANGRNRTELV